MLFCTLTIILFLILFCILLTRTLIQCLSRWKHPDLYKLSSGSLNIAFFHPYCNAGGGGERVLWTAIQALHKRYPRISCFVYTGDTNATPEEITENVRKRFNIVLPKVHFIYLYKRHLVEAPCYPHFTLLGQSLGSIILAFEALFKFVPDIYIDSMGYAFSVPIFYIFSGAKTISYVHYPTISTDMLSKVSNQTESFNNSAFISRSSVLTNVKIIYYKCFAFLYGLCGRCNNVVMVNSTWTHEHITSLWKCPDRVSIVHPPCDVDEFLTFPLTPRQKYVLSIAQFRPEKAHRLQITSFNNFLSKVSKQNRCQYKLILAGSCRNSEDDLRVQELKSLVNTMNLSDVVEFRLNISFEEFKSLLTESTIGLHTMKDEHFGIGIVECMAAGTIVLAHNSAGPKMDIVTEFNGHITGFLADDEASYAQAMQEIFSMSINEKNEVIVSARGAVRKFSVQQFEDKFISCISIVLNKDT